jgi:hypothetical protein
MNFYIYVYLDPRKPGHYEYGDYCFLYEPFYIEKGKGRRYKSIKRSIYFKHIINKIEMSKLNPIINKLYENLLEIESFELEKKLIKLIGRKNLGKGPLINFTNGGEGMSGWICSKIKIFMSKWTFPFNNME